MTYIDGAVYQGMWRDGIRWGEGTLQNADGSRYRGEWQYGKKSGTGIFTTADGVTEQ